MSMMPASPRLRVSRLAATTVLVLLALGITELLQTFLGIPTFFAILPVIVLTAAAWGAAIGILAAMLTTVGMALLLEPRWNLAVADPAERRLLVVFITVAFASVWIAHRYYRLREFTQRNAAEFRALFELAAVGSAAADLRTGRILRANQQFCTITGYSHRELESMTIAQITHRCAPSIAVMSRVAVRQLQYAPGPIEAVRDTLQVDYVVEGRVRHAGNRVRITIQLIDAADATHIWADAYERDRADNLSVQKDVARSIAEAVATRLLGFD